MHLEGHMHILVTTLVVHLCDMAEKQNQNRRQHLPLLPPSIPATPFAFAICRRFHYYFYFQPQSGRQGGCLETEAEWRGVYSMRASDFRSRCLNTYISVCYMPRQQHINIAFLACHTIILQHAARCCGRWVAVCRCCFLRAACIVCHKCKS